MTNPIATPVRKEYMWPDTSGRTVWSIVDVTDFEVLALDNLSEDEEEAYADQICLALNKHDALVEALRWGLDALLGMPESVRAGAGDAAIKQIRAVLARIEKGVNDGQA